MNTLTQSRLFKRLRSLLLLIFLMLLAVFLSPLFSEVLLQVAPKHTDGLLEITQTSRVVLQGDKRADPVVTTLPDDWKYTAPDATRVIYSITLNAEQVGVGRGLLVPAYRHLVKVWHQGHLIGERGTQGVGLPQRVMPPLIVMLPPLTDEANYRIDIEVLSDWSDEGGLGRVWVGEYTSLARRQGFVMRNHESIFWVATGTLLALTIYLTANSILMHENYLALFLVVAHFFYIYVCVVEHFPASPLFWFKLYFLFLVLALIGWSEHAFRMIGSPAGKAHLAFIPSACVLLVLFSQTDLDSALWWRNATIIVMLVMSPVYTYHLIKRAKLHRAANYERVTLLGLWIVMLSAGVSDIVAIHQVGAIEHTSSYRYLAVFVSSVMFAPMAIRVFKTEIELKKRKLELDQLVEERTGELIIAQSELEQNERYKTTYLLSSGLSHEIKNPLATLSATLHILRKQLGRGASVDLMPALDRMDRNVSRIDQTMRDLKVHAEDQSILLESSNFSDWLALYFEDNADSKELIEFQLNLNIQPVGILHFDPDKMYRVLSNLIQNSNRACAANTQKTLDVCLLDKGGEVALSITDNGSGLNDAISSRVLEPLVSGNHMGLGLGLAFVRDIVEKHGGEFSLKNNPEGQGVVASVNLPKQ